MSWKDVSAPTKTRRVWINQYVPDWYCYTISVSSVLWCPVKPSHVFIILDSLQSDFTYIITLDPKENPMRWLGQIKNIHIWNVAMKYRKYNTNLNLSLGKECRRDEKLKEHLNNRKPQPKTKRFHKKRIQLYQQSSCQYQKALWVLLAIVRSSTNLSTVFPFYIQASKLLDLDPFPSNLKGNDMYSSH